MKSRVCFVSYHAYALFKGDLNESFGGAEVQLYQLAKSLSPKDYRITFLVGDFGQKGVERFGDITVRKIFTKVPNPKFYSRLFYLRDFFRTLRKTNADVYIQRAAGTETGIVGIFTKLFQKKFIYMIAHEIDCTGEYIKKNGLSGQIYNLGIHLADQIIAQHQKQTKLLWKSHRLPSLVIRSGYPIPNQRRTATRRTILWVARLDRWKQPELVLKLAKDFPSHKFVMIAPRGADEKYAARIYQMALQLKNLKLIDRVPFFEINKYFSQAVIFVNTSLHEGFPNTFVQAAVHRTPIVSFKVDPDSIFRKHQIGFCANSDYKNLKQQIKILLKNSRLRKQIAENAFEYMKANHDIKKSVNSLTRVMKSLSR